MAARIRTFIGVPFPATTGIMAMLRELKTMGRSVRPTAPEQLHLTLKFLGDTSKDAVPAIRKTMAEVANTATRRSIELAGLGAFPNGQRPNVIWSGIQPEGELRQIASKLDVMLEPLGFPAERRPFHPHLTLARVNGSVAGLSEFLAGHATTSFGRAVLEKVTLYQSETGARGSRYTELASAPMR